MAKFKPVPPPQSEDNFVHGADIQPETTLTPVPESAETPPDVLRASQTKRTRVARKSKHAWDQFDPNENPSIPQTLRVNSHQHEQLRYLAQLEDRSISQILRRLLAPALEKSIRTATTDA